MRALRGEAVDSHHLIPAVTARSLDYFALPHMVGMEGVEPSMSPSQAEWPPPAVTPENYRRVGSELNGLSGASNPRDHRMRYRPIGSRGWSRTSYGHKARAVNGRVLSR